MSKVLVCGAGGFIGTHLVTKLKQAGYWVRGVDLSLPSFTNTDADEFLTLDLRDPSNCKAACQGIDEIYQLAADMGGMGFISSAECEIMHNSSLININMLHAASAAAVKRYFFSSSVCIYRDLSLDDPEISEEAAYPAEPDNEYGWEKLYAERMALARGRNSDLVVRIARFQNCYGELGTWTGGREKAPAAICRKIAQADNGGTIEVWGDGTATRSYIYVADLVEAVVTLMKSDIAEPTNIGNRQYVSVNELVATAAKVAKKEIHIEHIDGPVGVASRNFSNDRIESLNWLPKFDLEAGLTRAYPWIEQQVAKNKKE